MQIRIGYSHADRLISYPHRHNLSACAQPIRMFGPNLRAGPRPQVQPFAAGRSPSRERTSTHPVQNSPNTPPPAAHPVQNSPNTPKKAHFSQFCTSRENFVPHPPPRPPAGRTLYRAQCQTRHKTPPTRPRQQPNRYKTLPAPPFYSGSAKKFAQHTPHHNRTAKKFALHS